MFVDLGYQCRSRAVDASVERAREVRHAPVIREGLGQDLAERFLIGRAGRSDEHLESVGLSATPFRLGSVAAAGWFGRCYWSVAGGVAPANTPTPSCCIRPRSSRWFQISATFPLSSNRQMLTPARVARFPVGGTSPQGPL